MSVSVTENPNPFPANDDLEEHPEDFVEKTGDGALEEAKVL